MHIGKNISIKLSYDITKVAVSMPVAPPETSSQKMARIASAIVADGGTVNSDWAPQYTVLPSLVQSDASVILLPGAYKTGTIYAFDNTSGAIVPYVFTRAGAATYFDKDGKYSTAANDVPRVDYNPSDKSLKGYNIEPLVTNTIFNSNNIAGLGASGVTYGAKITTANDLVLTKVNESINNGDHRFQTSFFTLGGTKNMTGSFYFKPAERSVVRILFINGSSNNVVSITYNAITDSFVLPELTGSSTNVIFKREFLADGVIRLFLSALYPGSATNISIRVNIFNDANSGSYAGVATSGLYIGHIQLQNTPNDLPAPTSIVETTTAQVTKPADIGTLVIPAAGSLLINNAGVKTVTQVAAGSFTLPNGSIKAVAFFPRTLTAAEINQLTT